MPVRSGASKGGPTGSSAPTAYNAGRGGSPVALMVIAEPCGAYLRDDVGIVPYTRELPCHRTYSTTDALSGHY